MDKMIALRLPDLQAELRQKGNAEYIISMDVARSKAQNNNQTAFLVGRITRGKDKSIKSVAIVNIYIPPNGLNFTQQAIIMKKLQKAYNAQVCVVDTNGLGKGVADRLVEEIVDPNTGQLYEAWDCINDETFKSLVPNSPKILYSLNATSINTNIIINFWDYVETFRLHLLPTDKNASYLSEVTGVKSGKRKKTETTQMDEMEKIDCMAVHMRTDTLLEQISNLEVEKRGGNFIVKQITKGIDKDMFSALVYLLYVVQVHLNAKVEINIDYSDYMLYN